MIRPERIVIEPHAETGDERLPGIVERSVFLGGSHEVHVRVLGGELMKAMVANDGSPTPVSLEPGAAVSLRLPPAALRVLRPSEAGTEDAPWPRTRRCSSARPTSSCRRPSRRARRARASLSVRADGRRERQLPGRDLKLAGEDLPDPLARAFEWHRRVAQEHPQAQPVDERHGQVGRVPGIDPGELARRDALRDRPSRSSCGSACTSAPRSGAGSGRARPRATARPRAATPGGPGRSWAATARPRRRADVRPSRPSRTRRCRPPAAAARRPRRRRRSRASRPAAPRGCGSGSGRARSRRPPPSRSARSARRRSRARRSGRRRPAGSARARTARRLVRLVAHPTARSRSARMRSANHATAASRRDSGPGW